MYMSAGPCLPGASRLRVEDTVRFSIIIGDAFGYQAFAVELFTGPKSEVTYHHHPEDFECGTLPKNINFQAAFQGSKDQKS